MFEDEKPDFEGDSDAKCSDDTHQKNTVCPKINRTLLPSKIFYFFYFSSWGSLMPYLALYFKEMHLSPCKVGVLMGLRPFVNFIFTPLWGVLVDRTKKGKLVLMISLTATIFTTFSLSLVSSREKICLHSQRSANHSRRTLLNDSFPRQWQNYSRGSLNLTLNSYTFYPTSISALPWSLVFFSVDNYPSQTADTKHLFFQLFIILLFGNIMACPSVALVDTVTMKNLGKENHKYGIQRLWGSFGFGVAAFMIGACLSTTRYCPDLLTRPKLIDYSMSFYAFALCMVFALLSATKLDFTVSHSTDDQESTPRKTTLEEAHQSRNNTKCGYFLEHLSMLKHTMNFPFLFFLFTAFIFGFKAAFIKTFLFWHLKDLGGNEELFSIMAALHCIAEVTIYFLSARLITALGHIKVLYLGFFCYFLRCFTYFLLSNPWVVLPVEMLAGITSAAVWSAMLSYVNLMSNDDNATTMQGVLHGVHWGLGYGTGEMLGGLMVSALGTGTSFLLLGIISLLFLFAYSVSNNVAFIIKIMKYLQKQ